ncbi:MAG: hypothetical protein ACX936_21250 [Marinobacter sp.]
MEVNRPTVFVNGVVEYVSKVGLHLVPKRVEKVEFCPCSSQLGVVVRSGPMEGLIAHVPQELPVLPEEQDPGITESAIDTRPTPRVGNRDFIPGRSPATPEKLRPSDSVLSFPYPIEVWFHELVRRGWQIAAKQDLQNRPEVLRKVFRAGVFHVVLEVKPHVVTPRLSLGAPQKMLKGLCLDFTKRTQGRGRRVVHTQPWAKGQPVVDKLVEVYSVVAPAVERDFQGAPVDKAPTVVIEAKLVLDVVLVFGEVTPIFKEGAKIARGSEGTSYHQVARAGGKKWKESAWN